jgi:hypothetical protein
VRTWDKYGGMASLLITPEMLPGLSMSALVMLQRLDVDGYPLADDNASHFTQDRPFDVAERSLSQWQLYAFTAKYAAGFGELISSTGYLHRYSQDVEDGTMWFAAFQPLYYSPLPYLAAMVRQTYETREVTQELRFQSHLRGPVQFTAGFFYQRAATSSPFSYAIPGLDAASGYAVGADPIGAAFVRGEYNFVGSSLSLANGGTGLHRAEYSLLDLRSGLDFGAWTTTLLIKNVFNRAANYGDVVTAAGVVPGQTRLVVAQPRTIALGLQRSFGANER